MRNSLTLASIAALAVAASFAVGQPPEDTPGGPPPEGREPRDRRDRRDRRDAATFVDRMLAFDKDADGKLAKSEVTDERLIRLFDRADADHDGTVTRDELTALEESERETYGRRGARPDGPGGGPNGPGGPPGSGPPGGPGEFGPPGGFGPGGPMGRPRPGVILPPPVRDMLELTEEQRTQLDDLQKEIDARLEKILTEDQLRRLKQAQEFGPGRGPGGPDRRRDAGEGPGRPPR